MGFWRTDAILASTGQVTKVRINCPYGTTRPRAEWNVMYNGLQLLMCLLAYLP